MQNYFPNIFLLLAACYLLFLIKPAILGQLGGTFKSREVPKEYVVLKDFLVSQPEFFRTFWIPKKQRFGFFSNNHSAIDGQEFLKVASVSEVAERLNAEETKKLLSLAGVKYVIVPYDSEGELFLEDRKYSLKERKEVEKKLDQNSWLRKIESISYSNDTYHWSGLSLYEIPNFYDHFWAENHAGSQTPSLDYQMINPTKYKVQIICQGSTLCQGGTLNDWIPFNLIFSESYDQYWQAKEGEKKIPSRPYNDLFNSFAIDKVGGSEIIVEYAPQKYVNLGLIISGLTLIISTALLISESRRINKLY